LFPSARWKAYLRGLKDGRAPAAADGMPENSYSVFISQSVRFLQEEPSSHNRAAREYLDRCDVLLGECSAIVAALEETLENTPKPSQVLDWSSLW
jgi:hypothetical protein